MSLSARDIESRLVHDLYRRSFVIPRYTPCGWWECDLFELTTAGFFREYEIKISRSDFVNDAEKNQTRKQWWDAHFAKFVAAAGGTKHERLFRRDAVGPARFTFVVPEGLVQAEEVPEWAGLTYAVERPGHKRPFACVLRPVRPAPKLHRTKGEHLRSHAQSVCYYRMNTLYMRGENG